LDIIKCIQPFDNANEIKPFELNPYIMRTGNHYELTRKFIFKRNTSHDPYI